MLTKLSVGVSFVLALFGYLSPEPTDQGVRVALSKRGSLVMDDGTFDFRMHAKHLIKHHA